MEKITVFFGGAVILIGGILLIAPLAAGGGALAGLLVGFVFSDTMPRVMNALGIHGIALWQLGAFFGFAGSFLKTKVEVSEKA